MILKHIVHFIFRELSAGNLFQNLGVYTLIVLLVWVVTAQLKERQGKYRTR